MTTLKFLFAHAHTKLAFLDPWYRTSLSHFYSETQLLQPRLTWIFQQLLISAPLCLHSFRQRKKKRIEKCGSVSKSYFSNMAKHKMAKYVSISRKTSKCTANYSISFVVYHGFIGRKIMELWREESQPFSPGWAAHMMSIRWWTFHLQCSNHLICKAVALLHGVGF